MVKKEQTSFFKKHLHLKHFLIVLAVLIAIILASSCWTKFQSTRRQNALEPFYNTQTLDKAGAPGEVVRIESLGVNLQNGQAKRILYRSQRSSGESTFSSGMVFIPSNSLAGSPRPVVAWAHGTIGMGSQCAPSRIKNPVANIAWVEDMLAKGWVVVATDYTGLGTDGVEHYLIGEDEARDVINSVRAARNISVANAGSSYAVWGHSQGGHSALFTGSETKGYASELSLVGVVASAPAAELVPLLSEQYNTALDWVIGPEVIVSWPSVYTQLNKNILTTKGEKNYQRIANKCIVPATEEALVRTKFKQKFFSSNPVDDPSWRAVAKNQTAPTLDPSMPLMIAESLTDAVVLPNTTALYIQRACEANSNVSALWLNGVGHIALANVISPSVISWIDDRFNARQNVSTTCQQDPPVEPANSQG